MRVTSDTGRDCHFPLRTPAASCDVRRTFSGKGEQAMVNTTSADELEREAQEAAAPSESEDGAGIEVDAVEEAFDGPSATAETFDGIDSPFVDDDGETLADEALDELAAVEEAEADGIERARAALDAERRQTRAALNRYRDAVLAAEHALPAELVHGDTLEELEASLTAAREVVAGVRDRLTSSERGFPTGAPPRGSRGTSGLTATEKIRAGLEGR